jgi:hypothetical protein
MLNSGEKNCALRDKSNKYSNSRVVRKNNQQHWELEYFFREKP